MKFLGFGVLLGLSSLASAQTLLHDGFDSYSFSTVDGQGGWFTSSPTSFFVVPQGGDNPPATSGTQMLASNGLNTTVGNFIQPAWNARDPFKNMLIAETDLYVRSDDTSGRSLNFGIVSDAGQTLADIGYACNGDAFFVYSQTEGYGQGPSGSRNAWHHFMIKLDFDAKSTQYFVDDALIGSGSFHSDEVINSVKFNSVIGTAAPDAYWDSVNIKAVPEPASIFAVGWGGLLLLRRRKRSSS
ncbi:MAG: PEP-CTERM sorting domain-containing protein [Armatimonadetes bacterium]|nr:PEP-CTERM sorting domain-containing protein [Armatimonadota bacterium]MBS1728280.1 PEP-CTERM sorting domain-containing protein [Armatimonadota bacterium]